MNSIRHKTKAVFAAGIAGVLVAGVLAVVPASAQEAGRKGYEGVPRTWLWNPNFNEMVDTAKWKKEGPYTIGFSNASMSCRGCLIWWSSAT